MKNALLFVSALLCVTLTCHSKPAVSGAVPGQWTMDFEAAQQIAKQKKLPIFINFTGSDWCIWCKHMEKEVFSKPEWQNYAKDSLLMVWIDFPQDKSLVPPEYQKRNQQLAEFFRVEAYPTYIILDKDGKTQLGELLAEQQITPASFITKLKGVLNESESAILALTESMPAKEAAELKKAYADRKTARMELQQLQTKQTRLTAQLTALETTITSLRIKALVDRLTPAQASQYQTTRKELDAANSKLSKWIAANPPQTEENKKIYQDMNKQISGLENIINKLLYTQ